MRLDPSALWPRRATTARRVAVMLLVSLMPMALLLLAGCGVRSNVDWRRPGLGPEEKKARLLVYLADEPGDRDARRDLIALLLATKKPGAALAHLEALARSGALFGDGLTPGDRRRLGELLRARGTARLARGSAFAASDFERASALGVSAPVSVRRQARIARAAAQLRHADERERKRGREALRKLIAEPAMRRGSPIAGVANGADPTNVAAYGVWLWAQGAKRESYEVLTKWRINGGEGPALRTWSQASHWWSLELPPGSAWPCPTSDDGECSPGFFAAIHAADADTTAERDYLRWGRARPLASAADAEAWAILTLRAFIRGEFPDWHQALQLRVQGAAPALRRTAGLPFRASLLRAAGASDDADVALRLALREVPSDPAARAVLAAEAVLAGRPRSAVSHLFDGDDATWGELRSLIADELPPATPAFAVLAGQFAGRRAKADSDQVALAAVARAYQQDPALADRLANEYADARVDSGHAQAALAWIFEAVGDFARSRARWQAAVDDTADVEFLTEAAIAAARTRDAPLAGVGVTAAAAAAGDPAVVLLRVGRALLGAEQPVDALATARLTIDVAGPDHVVAGYDLAIEAAQALGRVDLAAELINERERYLPPGWPPVGESQVTVSAAPGALSIAQWVVFARWHRRDAAVRARIVEATVAGDPRHERARRELARLALDPDPDIARIAIAALRPSSRPHPTRKR